MIEDFLLAIFALTLLAYVTPAHAKTLAVASADGVTITLTDEPCALEAVTNLPRRAIWSEKDKRFEGCFNVGPGVVVAYFDDRTVALIPTQAFKSALEI